MRAGKSLSIAAVAVLMLGVSATQANAQPSPAPPPSPKTTIDGDGTYAVGVDIAPGNYSSAGPIPDGACYWKRISGDKLVDNALSKKSQVVSVAAGESFTTNDCQPWAQTDRSPPGPASPGDLLGQLGAFIGSGILGGGPRSAPPG